LAIFATQPEPERARAHFVAENTFAMEENLSPKQLAISKGELRLIALLRTVSAVSAGIQYFRDGNPIKGATSQATLLPVRNAWLLSKDVI
jgi:hypothetical protein